MNESTEPRELSETLSVLIPGVSEIFYSRVYTLAEGEAVKDISFETASINPTVEKPLIRFTASVSDPDRRILATALYNPESDTGTLRELKRVVTKLAEKAVVVLRDKTETTQCPFCEGTGFITEDSRSGKLIEAIRSFNRTERRC